MKTPLCTSQQDYLKEKQYILTNTNSVAHMIYSTKPFLELNNISQLNSNKGNFIIKFNEPNRLIEPEILIIAIFQSNITFEFQEILPFSSELKEAQIFILTEEILKHIDNKLKSKIFSDNYLNRVFLLSIVKIKEYFEKRDIKYKWEAFVWNDTEESDWEENIISIKIRYTNNKEKRKIWKEISSIVEREDKKGISLITEIKKL